MGDVRRFSIEGVPVLAKRAWEDVGPELERFLRKLFDSETDGIPAGFKGTVPSTIEAGVLGSPGTELAGWMPPDAVHPVLTAAATDLANANAEGTSNALTRADHKHKRSVRIKFNGADVGTRNAINFTDMGTTITDDPGNDEVDVPIATPGMVDDALAFAFLGY